MAVNKVSNDLYHYILAIILLSIGIIIYLLFRPCSYKAFFIIDKIGLNEIILKFRTVIEGVSLPEFLIYSLPGGLWLTSYLIIINRILYNEKTWKCLIFSVILPLYAIVIEFLQLFNIIPGYFDIIDLIFYIIPTLIYIKYLSYEKFN